MKKPKVYKPGNPGDVRRSIGKTLTEVKKELKNGADRSWYQKVGLLGGGKRERKT